MNKYIILNKLTELAEDGRFETFVIISVCVIVTLVIFSSLSNYKVAKNLRKENKLLKQQIKDLRDYDGKQNVRFDVIEKRLALLEKSARVFTSASPVPCSTEKGRNEARGLITDEGRYFKVGKGEKAYYINESTGEKKTVLGENDVEIVPHIRAEGEDSLDNEGEAAV